MTDLKTLSDNASPGEWGYRPYELDDWGCIRGGEVDSDLIGKIRPVAANSRNLWGDIDFDEHRRNKTDPMAANGKFIAALVNAYRSGQLAEVDILDE